VTEEHEISIALTAGLGGERYSSVRSASLSNSRWFGMRAQRTVLCPPLNFVTRTKPRHVLRVAGSTHLLTS